MMPDGDGPDAKRQKLEFTDIMTGATGDLEVAKASWEAGASNTNDWEQSINQALAPLGDGAPPAHKLGPPPGANPMIQPNELMFAYVHKTFAHKQFSLCLIDPNDESTTVYVHENVCPPHLLAKDQPVAFKVHMNAKNQPQASSPLWRLVGLQGLEAGSAVSWGEFEGRITGQMENGCASISCEQVQSNFGKEPYAAPPIVSTCELIPGDLLRFNITLDNDGCPSASAPLWKACKDPEENSGKGKGKGKKGDGKDGKGCKGCFDDGKGGKGKGFDGKGKGYDGGWDGGWVADGTGEPPTTLEIALGDSQTSSMYVGCVGKIAEDRQYSLFFCPDSGSAKPVYTHPSVCDPNMLEEHDMACFPLHWNHKGDPQALSPLWKLMGDMKFMRGLGFGEFVGRVTRIMDKGSGFVESPLVQRKHGRDAYLHASTIVGCNLKEGDFVVFDVHVANQLDQHGQPSTMPQVAEPLWKCMSPATVTTVWNQRMAPFCRGPEQKGKGKGLTANDSWQASAEEDDWESWMDAAWYMMSSMMMMTMDGVKGGDKGGKGKGDKGKGKKGKGKEEEGPWIQKGKDKGKGKGKDDWGEKGGGDGGWDSGGGDSGGGEQQWEFNRG